MIVRDCFPTFSTCYTCALLCFALCKALLAHSFISVHLRYLKHTITSFATSNQFTLLG